MSKLVRILVLLIATLVVPAQAQINVGDTLKLELAKTKPDSSKIDALNNYIFRFSAIQPDILLFYSDSAIKLSNSINDSLRLAQSVGRKGLIYYYLGDYNTSLDQYFTAIKIKEEIGETNTISEYNNIGLVLRNIGLNDEALNYFKISLDIVEKSGNKKLEATLLNNIGISYRGSERYDEAEHVLEKALEINSALNNQQSMAHNLNNLGNVYFYRKEYTKALVFFKKAHAINSSLNNHYEEAQNLDNIADTYLAIKDYSQARHYALQSEVILDKIHADKLKLRNLKILGNYYAAVNDFEKSTYYRDKYIVLNDSMLEFSNRIQFDNLKNLANAEKEIQKVQFLQQLNAIQEGKIKTQKTIQWVGIFVFILILAQLFWVARNLRIIKKLNTNLIYRTAEVESLNEELKATNEEINAQRDNLEQALIDLQMTQKQLIQSEKMASLGILAAGIAHEINNPLNFIKGGLTGIEEYLKDISKDNNEYIKPLINVMHTGVNRAADIVNSLHHYSSPGDKMHFDCDLKAIVENCLLILQNAIKERIEIIKNFEGSHYITKGNEGKLHQAIMNIMVNSVQAIKGKGTITISSRYSKGQILLSIADTGNGITKDNLSRIFDPFFTTKEPGQGTGLGLSIAYNIIKEHNGTINIESTNKKGTLTEIIFPCAINSLKT
jgi:signal transduction histidine kinase/Tfp pilus assembly protein PilF